MPDFTPLWSTIQIGSTTLANRVALAPMTRVSASEDGHATERMASYYERFARGGFGLLITEGIYPDTSYSQGYLFQPGIATAEQAPVSWSRWWSASMPPARGFSPSSCMPGRRPGQPIRGVLGGSVGDRPQG